MLALVALAAATMAWGVANCSPAPVATAAPPPAQEVPPVQGAASCASAACHNANGPRGSKFSEYTTWAAYDPHARAYRVLSDDRSRTVQDNLNRCLHQNQSAETNVRCLECHAVGPMAQPSLRADGVGCESCHGAAKNWRTIHYLGDWKGRTDKDKEALGFVNTKNLVDRARACAKCHVGSAEADVDHDLIAAGHPRLRFELGAYLANYYPKHWSEQAEKRSTPDLEARVWAVGQVVSAQAALQLLKARATAVEAHPERPWPELSEYECFACHHELSPATTWRQQRGNAGRKPGQWPWGTWYMPMLADLDKQTGGPTVTPALKELATQMAHPYPDPRIVAAKAEAAGGLLAPWLSRVASTSQGPESIRRHLAVLAAGGEEHLRAGPDQATQWYLAVAALDHALNDRAQPPDEALRDAVRACGNELDAAFGAPPQRYDSPRGFNPDALRGRLKTIQTLLGQN
jgi:hypothetical protein